MENNNKLQFCPKCGSPLIAGKNFCSQCGTNITLAQQQQPTQQANPYARPQQPTQQANPYARPQQPTQQANPYAQPQQPTQQANQYARPQQPVQQANPYARPQQPTQQANPYARPQQQTQQANPYARPQQPTQQANPYAQPQQPTQQANPYARPQQPVQQANPYAQPQQPTQQTNPYINNQSTQGVVNSVEKNSADNDFSQPINPYAPSMTASENLVAPKKRSKKPFIIAGVSVVGVAAVAVAGVMVLNKPSGGPITKIADSAKQLAKANSATMSASVEANGEKTKCDISYELDASKKEIVLVINGSSSYDSLSSSDTFKSVIYCKDGVRKSATTANGNTTYTEIDEETLNNFFDSINKTNAEQELDWNSLLEDADLKDYIDTTKIDAVSNSLKNTFENGNGKEALGIKESAVDNGTKYSFDINTYKTISIIVDEIEPLFKDKSKYNELKNELPKAESYLNSINLKFDITVDNAGYLSGFAFNSFGTKIDFSISKIGNTKVELSESEINDIKNAKATPSTGYIPDKYYDGDNAVDDINQVYDFT